MNKPKGYYAGMLAVVIIAMVPLFGHLDAAPIHIWDEARLATSALEMRHSHNWLVVTVDGMPDMWSSKPPLMIWIQALMINLVGVSELAFRLPSALAGLFTCLLLYWFLAKKQNAPLAGILAVLVLLTSHGYIVLHGTRSGDYDSLLTLLMTGYAVCYFLYLEEERPRYLFLTFVLLSLAALTKGVESLMFLPGLFIFTLYRRKLFPTLKRPAFYAGLLLFLLLVLGYYLLREHYNPGYIQAVMQNEIGGRYNKVIESHTGDGWHFFNILVSDQFRYWYLLIIPGLVTGFVSKERWLKDVTVFSFLVCFIYFVVVSGSSTQLDWYSMPMFPLLSMLPAIFIYIIWKALAAFEGWKTLMTHNVLPWLLIFLVFVIPYCTMINMCLAKDYEVTDEPVEKRDMKLFMKDIIHHDKSATGDILSESYDPDINWYLKVFREGHYPLRAIKREEIDTTGTVIAFLPQTKKYIRDHYKATVTATYDSVTIYKLYGTKTD